MTNNKWFPPTGFVMANLLCLALILNVSAADGKLASTAVSNDELANIEKTLDQAKNQFQQQKYEGFAFPILNALEKLSASTITDRVLFLTLRLKIAMGRLIGGQHYLKPDERTAVESYFKKHESEYISFSGITYHGSELKTLTTNFSSSPYLPDATFLMATEDVSTGECEADVDCHIRRSVEAYLPYIQAYPGHEKNRLAIEDINSDLERVTWDPQQNGLWEIYDLDATAALLKKYYGVVKTIADPELRAEALYLLARAFISVGEYKLVDSIYNDLESHNSKWRDAREKAAQLLFEFNKSEYSSATLTNSPEINQNIAQLNSTSESNRLAALNKLTTLSITDHTLLFKLLLVLSDMAEHDSSANVRKQAIAAVGQHASSTSFFRAVVGYCLQHEPDSKNRYYCANLIVTDPALTQTELYSLKTFRDQVTAIIAEAEGTTSRIDKIFAETGGGELKKLGQGPKKLSKTL